MKQFIILKKYTRLLLLAMIILLLWSCEKEIGDDKHPEELVGTWYYTDGNLYTEITTNSDQTMVNRFSEGIGSIEVEGDVTASLTYMMADEDYVKFVYVGNQSMVYIFQPDYSSYVSRPDYPFYEVMYSYVGDFSTRFIALISEEDYTSYTTETFDYSYDANTYTLTIDSISFFGVDMNTQQVDSSSMVTISGTIQNQTIDIPANSPTQVAFGEDQSDYISEFTISLEADGSWLRTMVTEFQGETRTETGVGTWEVDDNQLIIIEEYEEGGETEVDTIEFTFTLSGNTLTIISEERCEDDEEYTVEECLEEAEWEFGLESGSLTDIVYVWIINFSKTAPSARTLAKPSLKHLLQSKMPQHKWIRHHPFR